MKKLYLLCTTLICLFYCFSINAKELAGHHFQKNKPISNQQCLTCHQQEHNSWQQSDHAKAMAIANKQNILANFNDAEANHFGQKALFFIDKNQYFTTISYGEKVETYPIKYTFGFFPLQQYLVETKQGTLQVLPFSWDNRKTADGGQRWFHNYSHEAISPDDRLHWRQPLQNWNGMCADCHSDGLVRHYDPDTNNFSSQFDNINVGCLSCHGDMSDHARLRTTKGDATNPPVIQPTAGQWMVNKPGAKTAHWEGEARDNSFMDDCFACHSLRSPLNDGIEPKKPFLDQFTPQLLLPPLYHADGQIKEEVYVYGSFLQSKMFSAGVNCLDCHDKHTMKVKVEGNGLCLQCHNVDTFSQKSHHQHENNSSGAQCVNCHMPESRYMGVDDRRDHSFKIPRPDLSIAFNTPNACTKCHDDKTNKWAKEKLESWHGKPSQILTSKQRLMALNNGQTITLEQHLQIINDEKLDVISRASAIQLLSYSAAEFTGDMLAPYFKHSEALLRMSAASVALLLPEKDKIKYVSPLLDDKYKAVRVAAAKSLVSSNIPATNRLLFDKAFKSLIYANKVNSWRGEGASNQGILSIDSGKISDAEKSFKHATEIDPYFDGGYINLADLYRAQQKTLQAGSVLLSGIKYNPNSAVLHYAYGLYLIRLSETDKALSHFEKAMALEPINSQYAYIVVLAMDSSGQSKQALERLKMLIEKYQDKSQLKELGLYLSQKVNSRSDYNWFLSQ
ncbi:multiheme c-type cytochrome [Alkalimarinus alittae]|uniref:Uncharacterized protein n=1 Tax=Alkalimarinus alittae TaxID=2961619 RepID=A0ABY6N2N0_9ALTE|nr:multiheme c-type cytochrome [Alkalimarinus alittae]UZE96365.1 hypothetical protein NKI27_01060 [Alkalimarinus alittae]